MKLALMTFSLLALSYGAIAHHDGSDHDSDHNPHAVEETLYFSQNGSNQLREKAFEYLVFDETTGKNIVSPLGDTKFPYSALGEISEIMPVAGGHIAFKMSRVKASFDGNQAEVDEAFHKGQFYSAESDMIFLREDGRTVTTVENATYVIIPEFVTLELEEILRVKWNECSNNFFRGNYDDGNRALSCSRNRMMHDGFRGFLEKNLLSCVNDSLRDIGRSTSPDVYLVHKGTAADRLHSSGSMHQQGKAIDIKIIRVTGSDGKSYDIDYASAVRGTPGWRMKFYQSFRTCWGEAQLERDQSCTANNMYYNRIRNIPYYGSIGWEDSKHRVHLHISMPPCGRHKI